MGVPGLWDILNKVGKSTSIVRLSVVEGFELNRSRRRAYRIGVDASIWFHHATFSKQGENPETRGLFFRLIYLAKLPVIPLFVFDGRERPKIKRGSKMGKSGNHPRERQFKHLLDAFGMEWREARGEAEAELAYLNQKGHIDAVMTDDCDAFLFGARTIIKNISSKLTGNKNNLAKNSDDKADKYHTMVYRAEDIESDPSLSLSRGDLILFALLSGGDYHKGVERVGKKIALGLTRCGFGAELLEAYQNLRDYKDEFEEFLRQWRMRVNVELKQNSHGHLPHRTSLSLPDDFPNLDVLEYYANPVNSGSSGGQGSSSMALRDQKNLDLPKVAHICEKYFEWGHRVKIVERFRNLIWPCAVMHVLRRAALEVDHRNQIPHLSSNPQIPGSQGDIGTPASLVQKYLCSSHTDCSYDDLFVNKGSGPRPSAVPGVDANPLISRITKSRQHVSTDDLLEYQVEISPVQLIQLANSGIKGTRQAPEDVAGFRSPQKTSDTDSLTLWMPASMLSVVHPSMLKHFVEKSAEKLRKAKGKGKGEARDQVCMTRTESEEETTPPVLRRSEPQQQNLSKPKPVGQNSYIEVLKPTRTAVGLDPWFTSDVLVSQTLSRKKSSGFLFTTPNPDEEEREDENHNNKVDRPANESDNYNSEVGRPTNDFERMIDGILTKKRKPTEKLKKPRRSKVGVPQNITDERPSKKRKVSSRILDALDAAEL